MQLSSTGVVVVVVVVVVDIVLDFAVAVVVVVDVVVVVVEVVVESFGRALQSEYPLLHDPSELYGRHTPKPKHKGQY